MSDSTGAYRETFTPPHLVSVRALPAAGPGAGHWIVANVDQQSGVDPHTRFAELQVREIVGNGVMVRRVDVPGEMFAARADIQVATASTHMRVVERANGTGLITRSIGCE